MNRHIAQLICGFLLASVLSSDGSTSGPLLPMVLNTWDYQVANIEAWRVLNLSKGGLGQTRNAVVEGISECERQQCGNAVGYGGRPDEWGDVSLDALVMDGGTMEIGAVADLRRIRSAIKVARHVLEHTKHTLLVGNGAEDFANEMGFQNESLNTLETNELWMKWRANNCQPNFWKNVHPDPKVSCGPYSPITSWKDDRSRSEYEFGPNNHDTVTMIAIDENSNIHVGTSTNGISYTMPGRVGDSPIPGAGSYADNEVGAAIATGDGDIMMRFLPSLLAVEAMRAGKTPAEASKLALRRIGKYEVEFEGAIAAVNRLGEYAVICHGLKGEFSYMVSSPALPNQPTRRETIKCTVSKEELAAI